MTTPVDWEHSNEFFSILRELFTYGRDLVLGNLMYWDCFHKALQYGFAHCKTKFYEYKWMYEYICTEKNGIEAILLYTLSPTYNSEFKHAVVLQN